MLKLNYFKPLKIFYMEAGFIYNYAYKRGNVLSK